MAAVSANHQERPAKNEVAFRIVNDSILNLTSILGEDAPLGFMCECSRSGCFERLSLTVAEYERMRGNGTQYLLAPGHEHLEPERSITMQ